MTTPAQDLVNSLDADSSLGVAKGVSLFSGPMRAVSTNIPVDAVFIYPVGGIMPVRVMGQGKEVRNVGVFIRIRNKTYSSGDSLARAIVNYLQTISVTGYLDVKVSQSEAIYAGPTQEGYHLFTLTVSMVYQHG